MKTSYLVHDLLYPLFFFLVIAGNSCQLKQNHQEDRFESPDIIIILADDLGYADVGFHGSDIHTPNIDRIAREGVALESFYTAPMCSPTRAGLLTGTYPVAFGLMRSVIPPYRNFGLDPAQEILPEMLQQAGYEERACIGKWHLGHANPEWHPIHQGFTEFIGCYNGAVDYFTREREGEVDWHHNFETIKTDGYTTDLITEAAVSFIRKANRKAPYFLYIPYTAPHSPFQAKEEDEARYPHRSGKKRTYAGMVDCMDQGIGAILEAVEQRGNADNTFILFMSDNGGVNNIADNSPMRGHKLTVWEGGIRVVAAAKWPAGGVTGGGIFQQRIGYIDVFSMLKRISSHKISSSDQRGFAALLNPHQLSSTRPWVTYLDQNPQMRQRFAIHQGKWKLILRQDAPDYPGPRREPELLFFQLDSLHTELTATNPDPLLGDSMLQYVSGFQQAILADQIPRYFEGRESFHAPPDWVIDSVTSAQYWD